LQTSGAKFAITENFGLIMYVFVPYIFRKLLKQKNAFGFVKQKNCLNGKCLCE